jgi:hypothetical protein
VIMSGYTEAAAANWDATFVRAAKLRENGQPIELTQAEFDALPEYSCSIPTTSSRVDNVGRRWKRDQNAFGRGPDTPNWWMGEFIPDDRPDSLGIIWRPIVIADEGRS